MKRRYFAPAWMFGSSWWTSPTCISLPVLGKTCITPTAPARLRRALSSWDSWYPWAVSMSQSNSYCSPYLRNSDTVRSYFATSPGSSAFFTNFVLRRYRVNTWLPKDVPCLWPATKRLTAARSFGLPFRNAHAMAASVRRAASGWRRILGKTCAQNSALWLSTTTSRTRPALTISRRSSSSRASGASFRRTAGLPAFWSSPLSRTRLS